jgi:K+/H+ antiporter YhaU regulatory subunit KhtT
MTVRVREQSLPGIGRRYELEVGADTTLVIIEERRGGRRLAATRSTLAEELWSEIPLDPDEAATLGALLLGARFAVEDTEPESGETSPPHDPCGVVVETVTLPGGSPAIGRLAAELPLDGSVVLAIITESAPVLVRDLSDRPIGAGDKLVLAARADHMSVVIRRLRGLTQSDTD